MAAESSANVVRITPVLSRQLQSLQQLLHSRSSKVSLLNRCQSWSSRTGRVASRHSVRVIANENSFSNIAMNSALQSQLQQHDQVIAKNSTASWTSISSKEMLKNNPIGAYTTGRTIDDGCSIFQLDYHVDRLLASARMMRQSEHFKRDLDEDYARHEILSTIRTSLRHYREVYAIDRLYGGDLRFTVLLTWAPHDDVSDASARLEQLRYSATHPRAAAASDQNHAQNDLVNIYMHTERLPPVPKPPIVCEVRGSPRDNAQAKNSQWVTDRVALEKKRAADVDEILLESADGKILEGSQSNFFAVFDGKVFTAGEGVLAGTVRDVVFDVCEDLGIPVHLVAPNRASCATWSCAFITSTSRLVLPIDVISFPTESPPRRHSFTDHSLALQIRDAVLETMHRKSTRIV
eukprot:m.101101 g.101101  ORF g.101101 m.101101 type:complete len:406 (-) comp16793_c0_seq1:1169-2386(-)